MQHKFATFTESHVNPSTPTRSFFKNIGDKKCMCKYDICTLQILYTDCRSKKKSSQYKQFCQNNVAHLIINLQKKGNQCPLLYR